MEEIHDKYSEINKKIRKYNMQMKKEWVLNCLIYFSFLLIWLISTKLRMIEVVLLLSYFNKSSLISVRNLKRITKMNEKSGFLDLIKR